ncbi:MAG: 4-hydroxythreonine-4-phosphate dehydrogenase PdxA [Flavobacteriales bacterium]|nr:4-hydroxythreonine-4-phosphate dehydrogenase PdxA [Flavobacteriales bacterium]
MTKKKVGKVKVGISVGDPNGIGIEVILKTFQDNRMLELFTPILFGAKKIFVQQLKTFHINELRFNFISSLEEVKASQVNVFTVCDENFKIEYGVESPSAGVFAFESLSKATDLLKEGELDALVTAPINKKAIQSVDFDFPGHTEYLQSKDGAEDSLMLMLSDNARIGVVTGHIPLSEVGGQLSAELILKKITILNKSLREDFNIRKPKIAVMGLNPHAGDNGLLGKEEQELIIPAINQAKSIGILAFGPYAADGFFGSLTYKHYDGVLAMYHDQGLIPAKSFSFGEGVNFTAGLSFVRTSPDHGTAFEIAGKGEADEGSFRTALYKAIEIVRNRQMNKELGAEALFVNKNRN